MRTEPADQARRDVNQAVNQAPRGMALPAAERTALDSIEELAYPEGVYTSRDMSAMFITRWGRPLRRAASLPKTFIHRLWQALRQLPQDQVLLNNVVTYFEENPEARSAGSYTDWLGDARTHGRVRYDRPAAFDAVHAARAQNSRTIEVREPHVDLLRRGNQVRVALADGTQATVRVRAVDARRRRLTLSQRVNVAADAAITATTSSEPARGEALRVTARATLFGTTGGNPDLANQLGTVQPGNIFSKTGEQTVGGNRYFQGMVYEGTLRRTGGWILATATGAMTGAPTLGSEHFAWTVRHEMGHSLDTQIGGFSRFSAPSAAQWVKYTGVDDWVGAVVGAGGVANPGTAQVFNGVNLSFNQAASTYSQAVQSRRTTSAAARRARRWLQGWQAAGGSQDVYNTVTQFNATGAYFNQNNRGLPPLGDRVYAAHYGEWFSFADGARSDSLAVGVPPYAYTCTYEFFAEHYAAYTGPGTGAERYARAVPSWALNFFDRTVGRRGAGPQVGTQ
jgi:hypothetical protein